jgi:hypothetical protein
MPQIRALTQYLGQHPPVHLVVAAFAGIKAQPEPRRVSVVSEALEAHTVTAEQPGELDSLFAAFGAAGGVVRTG